MDNIQSLLDFLDENEIECVEGDNELTIYRNYSQVRISFNTYDNMYHGILEGNGFSSFFYGDEIFFDYDENLEQFEIWFRKVTHDNIQTSSIYIDKEETFL